MASMNDQEETPAVNYTRRSERLPLYVINDCLTSVHSKGARKFSHARNLASVHSDKKYLNQDQSHPLIQ